MKKPSQTKPPHTFIFQKAQQLAKGIAWHSCLDNLSNRRPCPNSRKLLLVFFSSQIHSNLFVWKCIFCTYFFKNPLNNPLNHKN